MFGGLRWGWYIPVVVWECSHRTKCPQETGFSFRTHSSSFILMGFLNAQIKSEDSDLTFFHCFCIPGVFYDVAAKDSFGARRSAHPLLIEGPVINDV